MSDHSTDPLSALVDAIADRVAERLRTESSAAPSRWIPLRESPLGYRPTLDLIRARELTAHGIGHRRYVDREQIDRWLETHPIAPRESGADDDDIDELVVAHHQRRARRHTVAT